MVLCKGTAHSSEKFDEILPDLLDRIKGKLCLSTSVSVDAGFQGDSAYSVLEKHKTPDIGHLKPNATLDKLSAPYLVRPDETELPKEPRTWFYEFGYRAGRWRRRPGKAGVSSVFVSEYSLWHPASCSTPAR
jgi:hypothetical protein